MQFCSLKYQFVLQGFLDITNSLECCLKAHTVRTSHTSVCGDIDASLFLSCGQFRYFWLGMSSGENTMQESDRNYSIYIYVVFIMRWWHSSATTDVMQAHQTLSMGRVLVWDYVDHLHQQETRFVRVSPSVPIWCQLDIEVRKLTTRNALMLVKDRWVSR